MAAAAELDQYVLTLEKYLKTAKELILGPEYDKEKIQLHLSKFERYIPKIKNFRSKIKNFRPKIARDKVILRKKPFH